MTIAAGDQSPPSDRATVERAARELVRQHTPPGISVVIEGAPGIGKTFLARKILACVPPGEAKVLTVAAGPAERPVRRRRSACG